MERIDDWLEKLGMSEYAQRFLENDIDFTILAELSDQALEKIGIASPCYRRRILKAIAALNLPEPALSPPVAASGPAQSAPPSAPATEAAGERRFLTVMFCDLVGSTEIPDTKCSDDIPPTSGAPVR